MMPAYDRALDVFLAAAGPRGAISALVSIWAFTTFLARRRSDDEGARRL